MEGVRTNFYTSFYAGTKTIFLDGVSFYRAMYRDITSELLKVASTWKKYNSFQISKSKSQNHSKNERARGTIVRTNSSSSFSFILLSMLVRLPFSMGYLFLEILDLILSKFPNIQRTRGTNKFDQIGDYPATNYPRQADKRVAL